MFTKMCSCVNSSGAGPVEITQLRYLKAMLAIISCDRGKEPVFIWSFAVGKALNPFVPCACGHAVDAVHQEPHTSCQSFTGACGQLRGIPGASHCSRFTLDSPHLGNDTTEGPSQRQLCHWFWSRQLCTAPLGSHIAQCVLSLQFLRMEIFWPWKYLLSVKHWQSWSCASAAAPSSCCWTNRQCCLSTRACQLLLTRSCLGNLLHRNPHYSHTLDLHHHLNATQWTQTAKK